MRKNLRTSLAMPKGSGRGSEDIEGLGSIGRMSGIRINKKIN
jgi:hypothetical protein